jgi:oxygen-dependent protoporphyrinogen oxidase
VKVVVVGAGITGLTAAYDLSQRGHDVTVLDADDRAGGKILTTPFAGLPAVDCGPDAFLARVPAAVALCRELGFGDELISPATGAARIWSHGALRPIPLPNFLGVPLAAEPLVASRIVGADAGRWVERDLARTVDEGQPDGDESVGDLVRRRLGDEVLERLVDPLLGGIYAGDADRLSLRAGAPQLWHAARANPSLVRGLLDMRRAAEAASPPDAPVFFAPPDGMTRLVRELTARLGERVRLGQPVTRIERDDEHWVVDGTRAEGVVLTTPSFATAQLLRDAAPDTATLLDAIEYAGVALVTFAIPRDAIESPLDASGFLVPKAESMLLTACSWASTKWAHLDRGKHIVLRASAGHFGNEYALTLDDDALVRAMFDELALMMGLQAEPVEVRVSRWPRSFPQYTPGHDERVDEIERHLAREAPGVALAGAPYRGIGLPACITQAHAAAAAVAASS